MTQSANLPFYKILQSLEEKRGFTEKDVLSRLGLPRSTYRAWRHGYSEPSKRIHWKKLAATFDTDLETLITGRGIEYRPKTPWFLKPEFSRGAL